MTESAREAEGLGVEEPQPEEALPQANAQDLRHLTLITKHIDKLSEAGIRWLHVHMMGR